MKHTMQRLGLAAFVAGSIALVSLVSIMGIILLAALDRSIPPVISYVLVGTTSALAGALTIPPLMMENRNGTHPQPPSHPSIILPPR